MSIRDVKTIIKDGGGMPSLPKKKKDEEEEKVVAVIKDSDSPPLAGGVANRNSAQNGVRTQSSAESRQPTPTAPSRGTSLKREANGTPTLLPAATTGSSSSGVREFTYDDYLKVSAASRAEKMLDEYLKTGNVSGLSTDTVKKLTDLGIRFSGGESGYTSPIRAIVKTDGVERKSWEDVNPLPRFGGEVAGGKGVTSRTTSNTGNTDPSSPTAPWRNPETFQALPEADYNSLSREDQKAYLKSGENHALFVRQQKEAEAAARLKMENQEASDKMLADYFYNKLLKGDSFDLSSLTTKTRENIRKKAHEAYSNGEISKADYWDMSARITKSLDNTPSKVYNEVKDTTTNPLLKNSGFNRYTNTPSAVLFPEDTSGEIAPSNNGNSEYGAYRDVISKAMNNIRKAMLKSSDRAYFSDNFIEATDDAFAKIITAIESGEDTEAFVDGIKVRIDIVENFNSSGLDLIAELVGLIPYFGPLYGLVDYMSDEKNNTEDLLGVLGGLLFEDGFKNLPEVLDDPTLAQALKLGKNFSYLLSAGDIVETAMNYNSPDKIGTGISIYIQDNKNGYYQYDAYVDKDLNFKVLGVYYTRNIEFIKDKEFEISVK